jgi:agmatine deiminase
VSGPTATHRLPAEWEPQEATFLSWPHRRATWPDHFGPVPAVYARVAALVARHQRVWIVAAGEALAEARERLAGVERIGFLDIPTSDGWIRDTGPVFLLPRSPGAAGGAGERAPEVPRSTAGQPGPLALCFDFNAWGGKYPPWELDAAVAERVAEHLGLPALRPGLVLEGGAIETDGAGTLLVNRRCVIDPARNPGLTREEAEYRMRSWLGIERVIWIDGVLAGDDTDGHVDQVARFVAPGRVAVARQPDRSDPNHAILEGVAASLARARDAGGGALELVPVDIPARFERHGVQLPASHLNFLLTNGSVLVPVFGGPTDEAALATLAGCFPGRAIEQVDSSDLVWGRGAVHCITRDQPAWPAAAS